MHGSIIWTVLWAVFTIFSFYGGLIGASLILLGTVFGAIQRFFDMSERSRVPVGRLLGAVVFLLLAWAFAVFSLIQFIINLISLFR
jgi:hypothetical protein